MTPGAGRVTATVPTAHRNTRWATAARRKADCRAGARIATEKNGASMGRWSARGRTGAEGGRDAQLGAGVEVQGVRAVQRVVHGDHERRAVRPAAGVLDLQGPLEDPPLAATDPGQVGGRAVVAVRPLERLARRGRKREVPGPEQVIG